VGLTDNDLQSILQLTVELASSVLQTSNMYIAEILDEKPLLKGAHSPLPMEGRNAENMETKFMFTAVTALNSFLMGDSLPTSTMTYKHFVHQKSHEPLVISIKDAWETLHFFKKDLSRPTSDNIMYVAAPYFDGVGQIRGYIAADSLRMHEGTVFADPHQAFGLLLFPCASDFPLTQDQFAGS
jgi:hypothetical protein